MRRTRAILAMAALVATLTQPVPTRAARTLDIEIFGVTASPPVLIAAGGDQIRFTVTDGTHSIVSYASVGPLDPFDNTRGPETTFESGVVTGTRNNPVDFGAEFTGGTVRYRCLRHSKFDESNGVCDGLCAVITDEDTPPIPPVIDEPTRTIRERPATIEGTAEPLTLVTLAQGSSFESGAYRGQALTDANGRWAVKTVDFGTIGGSKSLVARAVRGVGYVSADSAIVKYNYTPDITPPTITWDPLPTVPVFTGPLVFSGTVSDNIGVRGVQIRFSRLDPNTRGVEQIQKIFVLAADCEPDCPILTSDPIQWSFEMDEIPNEPLASLYAVTAIAIDTSNLTGAAGAPSLGNQVVHVPLSCQRDGLPSPAPSNNVTCTAPTLSPSASPSPSPSPSP